jgi:hypothetical protein
VEAHLEPWKLTLEPWRLTLEPWRLILEEWIMLTGGAFEAYFGAVKSPIL